MGLIWALVLFLVFVSGGSALEGLFVSLADGVSILYMDC